MGASLGGLCGSDIFQQLKKKYGQEFVKLIIAEKAKDAVTTRFGQVAVQLEGIFNEGRAMTTGMVTQKTNYITGLFNELKATVESKVPGGIRIVQQLKGQPIEEIVGFNKLIMVVNQIQGKALGQISNKQGIITEELRTRQQNFIQAVNDQKPKLPLYDQLPEAIQRQILHKGQEVFMSQVEARQQEMMKQIDGEISIDKVKDVITQLIPNKELNSVAGDAQNSFSNVLPSLLSGGGGGSGGIAGIAGTLGGMFGGNGNNNTLTNLTNNIPFLNFGNNNKASENANTNANNPNNSNSARNQGETKEGLGYVMNNLFI